LHGRGRLETNVSTTPREIADGVLLLRTALVNVFVIREATS